MPPPQRARRPRYQARRHRISRVSLGSKGSAQGPLRNSGKGLEVVKFVGANGYLHYHRVAAEDVQAPLPQTRDGAQVAPTTARWTRSPAALSGALSSAPERRLSSKQKGRGLESPPSKASS